MSGGPSTALGAAASELVSGFPLWSALALTAKAPASPVSLTRFFQFQKVSPQKNCGSAFGSGHCVGVGGGWLNSALFTLFPSQVTQGGGRGTAVSDGSSWDMG